MYPLKLLQRDAIPAALEKALRYRVLNEPADAESICLDVLAIEPDHQEALVTLLLSLSDQFRERPVEKFRRAEALLPRIEDRHARAYYKGLLAERRAKACMAAGTPGYGPVAYEWFRRAMESYEQAFELAPSGNDDATLRWNSCARALNEHTELAPAPNDTAPPMLE